jgi:aryl-alcohol dehydrogenase-like predicted oxidoreductase
MQLDHYVTLGRSGLRVSPLCLGAMTFGEDLGWGTPVKESQLIIDRFLELGGNFIDTANFYTKSHSEKILGPPRAPQGQTRPPGHCDQVQRQPLPG